MKNYLTKQILRVIKRVFPYLTKPQKQTLAELVVALMSPSKFTLREIASYLSGDTNVKLKLKRLKNFLDRFKIDFQFWSNFVKLVFSLPYFRLNKRKVITLVIDATTLKDDLWILGASITYRGRCIPVYLKSWREPNSSYDFWSRVSIFLRDLKKILPERFRYEIIGDRGFQSTKLFEICKELDWDYVVRINGNWMCKVSGGKYYMQLSLFEDGFYENVVLGKRGKYEDVNIAINSIRDEAGEKIRWYLATSLKERERAITDYERRMWIEESFKDLKSILKWEGYTKKIPEKGRLEKLIAVSLISYTIGLSIGSKVSVPPSEEKKTSLYKRFQHLIVSWSRNAQKIVCLVITMFLVYLWRIYGI